MTTMIKQTEANKSKLVRDLKLILKSQFSEIRKLLIDEKKDARRAATIDPRSFKR